MQGNKLRNIYIITAILVIVSAMVYILSVIPIWTGDSLTYQYNFGTLKKITTFGEIFRSQYYHYLFINGRYVAHFLCQMFLALIGKPIFALCNAMVYVALILLILKYACGSVRSWKSVLTASILVLLYADTEYIPTCQIGYVWMPCLIVAYLMLLQTSASKTNAWELPFLGIFSIIAGNAHENINIGIGGALCIYLIFNLRRITLRQWVMILGFGLGALILCLSPGNLTRSNLYDIPLPFTVIQFICSLRVTYLMLLILTYKILCKSLSIRQFYHDNSILINAIFVLLIFNFAIGITSNRQLMGIELISVVLILRILRNAQFSNFWLIMGTIGILSLYTLKYKEISKFNRAYTDLKTLIIECEGEIGFIELPQFSNLVHPMTQIRFGSIDYILTSFQKEYASTDRGAVDNIKVMPYPLISEPAIYGNVRNQAIEYLPGDFLLLQDKDNPRPFILHRAIDFFGIYINLPDVVLDPSTNAYCETDDYYVLYANGIAPVIRNTSVEVLDCR